MNDSFNSKINEKLKLIKLAYKILDIPCGSEEIEIRKAYRNLAMKFHPDRDPKNKELEKKFINIQNAYEFLMSQKNLGKIKLENPDVSDFTPEDEQYILDNDWGYFLWWRDKFFQ